MSTTHNLHLSNHSDYWIKYGSIESIYAEAGVEPPLIRETFNDHFQRASLLDFKYQTHIIWWGEPYKMKIAKEGIERCKQIELYIHN